MYPHSTMCSKMEEIKKSNDAPAAANKKMITENVPKEHIKVACPKNVTQATNAQYREKNRFK